MIKFTCPKCGCHTAEEVIVDTTVSIRILGIDEDTGEIEYDADSFDGGVVDRYQCEHCGYVIEGIDNCEDMAEFIKNGSKENGETEIFNKIEKSKFIEYDNTLFQVMFHKRENKEVELKNLDDGSCFFVRLSELVNKKIKYFTLKREA